MAALILDNVEGPPLGPGILEWCWTALLAFCPLAVSSEPPGKATSMNGT